MATKTIYKVNGFKFHQYALNLLKERVNDEDYPLHASAVAAYIGLVSVASPSGLIPSDKKKADLADLLHLSRQTFNDGYKSLIEHKLISEKTVNDHVQIELTGYAASNFDNSKSKHLKGNVSYFEVANELFNTEVIPDLVKSKETHGLILLLDLFNHFSRELNRNKKHPANAPDILTMSYLKRYLNKCNARRVRKVLDIYSPLFSFVPDGISERKPGEVEKPVRKMVTQIWIKKYKVYINPTCTTQKEATDAEIIESAKAIKDAHFRIKSLQLPLKQADKNGIGIAYRLFIREVARFIKDAKVQKDLLCESMQSALEDLEAYSKQKDIKSIGSYINNRLQQYVFNFLDKHVGLATDMLTHYQVTGADIPTVLSKYQSHKAA